jgi:hypothetical protein
MGLTSFIALSIASFIAATFGFDVIARTTVGNETLHYAMSAHLAFALGSPVETAMLIAPFITLAFICAGVAWKIRLRNALIIFILFDLILLYLYFSTYQGYQQALLEHAWTAASLSMGLLPFLTIPVLIVAVIASLIAIKINRRRVLS